MIQKFLYNNRIRLSLSLLAGYEFGHKIHVYKNTKISDDLNPRKIYYSEMAIIGAVSTIYSPILAPVHFINDIIKLEASSYGHINKKERIGYSWFDIMFM